MHQALFRTLFEGAEDIGKEEMLLQIGASVGLKREGFRFALEEVRYTEKVFADEELTRRLDVGSVPTMFVGLPASRSRKPRPSSVLSPTADASKPPSNRPCRAMDLLGCIFCSPSITRGMACERLSQLSIWLQADVLE